MDCKVTIGSGDRRNSAISVFDLDLVHDISENQNCYWVSTSFHGTVPGGHYLPGLDMTIFKDTPEGADLKVKIAGRQAGKLDREPFDDWLHSLALKHAAPDQLLYMIRRGLTEACRHGRLTKAAEIRQALGIAR